MLEHFRRAKPQAERAKELARERAIQQNITKIKEDIDALSEEEARILAILQNSAIINTDPEHFPTDEESEAITQANGRLLNARSN